MRRLLECDAYLRAAFNWKLDSTKNCISYGIIIFRSFDFDDIRAAALFGAFFSPKCGAYSSKCGKCLFFDFWNQGVLQLTVLVWSYSRTSLGYVHTALDEFSTG